MTESVFFRAILVPGVVWLSVFFGAATGSGREIIEYITPSGPWGGVIAVSAITLTFVVTIFICFELARLFKAYDYRLMSKQLLGRAWPIYEITLILGMILAIAIASTASGELLYKRFEIPKLWGTGGLLLLIIISVYLGRTFIEKSMTAAVVALFITFAIMAYKIISNDDVVLAAKFAESEFHFGGVPTALQYALVNASYVPLILFAARDIRSRGESLLGACSAAIAASIPLIFLHSMFVAGYPEILDVELPVYWLLKKVTSDAFVDVYVAILFILIVQTGVGLLQGFIERVDSWFKQRTGKPMSSLWHASVSFWVLVVSLLLSTIGLVNLIINAYSILFMAFIFTFVIPLLTIGSYKIFTSK